jgi:phosphate butyryltransferase
MGFADLASRIRARGPKTLVVVAAEEEAVLDGVARAAEDGIATPVLFGHAAAIASLADELHVDTSRFTVVDIEDPIEAAVAAMAFIREGRADAVMKGRIPTPDFMRACLKNGLKREGRLLSHLALFDHPRLGRLLALTDSGVVPFPTIDQRVAILKNAVGAMRALGVAEPKIAGLSSSEVPDDKIPPSMEMARLKEMNAPGGALHGFGVIDGPLDLFSAIDPRAAETKGLAGAVVGRADILHCPDVVSGNLMGKSIVFFADDVRTGGCVIGGAVPIVLLSRASSADDKYCSIVAALSCAGI